MDKPTCETCPYWGGEEGDEGGECRRRPPRVVDEVVARFRNDTDDDDTQDRAIDAASSSYCSFYPIVQSYYWCGEHPAFPAWIESQRKPTEITEEQAYATLSKAARDLMNIQAANGNRRPLELP